MVSLSTTSRSVDPFLGFGEGARPGGGGGHSLQILVGMCHGNVKNGGSRASSSVKMRVSGTDFVGCIWLALWPAVTPGCCPNALHLG